MQFGPSGAQRLLQQNARALLAEHCPVGRVRAVMRPEGGCDRELFGRLGEQGLAGLLVRADRGGEGLGLFEAAALAQELGRVAAPLPYSEHCVLAPLLLAGCQHEVADRWLEEICRGERLVSTILASDPLHDDETVAFGVIGAPFADAFVIVDGSGLVLLERSGAGIVVTGQATVDQTRALGDVAIARERLAAAPRVELGTAPADASTLVARAVSAARITLAADLLGAAQRALVMAVEYAQSRRQFGRVIGSYQAVKHLCAEVAAAVEPVQSLLWYAAHAWDQNDPNAAWLAPLLKAHAAEVATEAVTVATQVFGGLGFTWDCDLHLWFKRVAWDRQVLGGPSDLFAEAARKRLDGSTRAAGPTGPAAPGLAVG